MKHRLFLIIATLVGLGSITTSCSWDDELVVANNEGDQKTPISFNVNIGSLPDPEVTTRSNDPLGADVSKATRGITENTDGSTYTFIATDVVAVSLCGVSGSSRTTGEANAETKLYTVAAGSGSKTLTYSSGGTNAFDWLGTSETVSIRAWSFGDNSTTTTDPDGQTFTISTTQDSDASTKELLYSPATNYSYGNIPIPLYHQLSRIVVNIKGTLENSTSGSAITISGVAIGDGNMPVSATFTRPELDVFNSWKYVSTTPYYVKNSDSSTRTGVDAALYGSWSSYGTSDQTITAKAETANSGYTATYSAVVLPNTYGNATGGAVKFIIITTSNGTYSYYIAANSTITLNPGKQYTFNITDLNQIDFNVTVSAWDGGSGDPSATDLTFE